MKWLSAKQLSAKQWRGNIKTKYKSCHVPLVDITTEVWKHQKSSFDSVIETCVPWNWKLRESKPHSEITGDYRGEAWSKGQLHQPIPFPGPGGLQELNWNEENCREGEQKTWEQLLPFDSWTFVSVSIANQTCVFYSSQSIPQLCPAPLKVVQKSVGKMLFEIPKCRAITSRTPILPMI